MDIVTLLVAVVGSLAVLSVKPIYGLAVYTVLSIWYPYYVGTVDIGMVHFSAGRIVIIVLFLKIFYATNLARGFKFIWLDRFVIILFLVEVAAGLTTIEPMKLIIYRSGDFFDMALPYFAVRLIVTGREHYISLLKVIAWSVAVLAIFAGYESLTSHNLVGFGQPQLPPEKRMNLFYRAQATFHHPIYFGVFSAMVATLCFGLVKNSKKSSTNYAILVGLIFLGAVFSMSSGGVLAMVASIVFMCFYPFRRMWKTAFVAIIIMCGLVEIISNRHFYNVMDYFTFDASNTWYRARLLEVAFSEGGMSGHWLTGYGFDEPGWGYKIDTTERTDMVNHYLFELSRYGLVGFIPFCAVIITAIKELFRGFWVIKSNSDRWLIWCIASSLFGVLLTFNTVSLFGQPMTLLYMMFGFCVVVPKVITGATLNRQMIPAQIKSGQL